MSTEVLEHIPASILPRLLECAGELMSPGGLALHSIDYSDHFARGSGASRFNFLRYSDSDWKRFNSSFQYVNRLRHSQYIDLFRRSGFELIEQTSFAGDLPPDVTRELAPEFQGFAADDLATLRAFLVARWPRTSSSQEHA